MALKSVLVVCGLQLQCPSLVSASNTSKLWALSRIQSKGVTHVFSRSRCGEHKRDIEQSCNV
jgi:hypothetical protein